MVTLLGSLLGFISATFPDILKFLQDKQDRQHELAIMERQLALREKAQSERFEAIGAWQLSQEMEQLYKTFHSGIRWVDALNATVRPVLAYAFFLLYACVKLWQAQVAHMMGLDGPAMLAYVWTEDDRAIFAGIISFYFGQRAMRKVRR